MFSILYSPHSPSSILSSSKTRANYHPPGGVKSFRKYFLLTAFWKMYIVVEQKAGRVHDLRCSVEGDTASLGRESQLD